MGKINQIWQDHIVTNPDEFQINDLGGGISKLIAAFGTIIQQGTEFTSTIMNKITGAAEDANNYYLTAGSGSAFTVQTANQNYTYQSNVVIKIQAHVNSLDDPTVNVDSQGIVDMVYESGEQLKADALEANKYYEFIYNGSEMVLLERGGGGLNPLEYSPMKRFIEDNSPVFNTLTTLVEFTNKPGYISDCYLYSGGSFDNTPELYITIDGVQYLYTRGESTSDRSLGGIVSKSTMFGLDSGGDMVMVRADNTEGEVQAAASTGSGLALIPDDYDPNVRQVGALLLDDFVRIPFKDLKVEYKSLSGSERIDFTLMGGFLK